MARVRANGIEIAYEEQGQGDPLVLIMGLGADGSLWEDHVRAYQEHFRCIMMDNRGAGGSDKPKGPYTTKMMAADTAGLMDALGIEKARVAGISMGGCLALDYPDKVRSQVLVSTWPKCNTYAAVVFEHLKSMRALASPSDFTRLLQLWIYAAPYFEENLEELCEAQQEAADNYMPLHAFAAQCDACITHDTLDRLMPLHAFAAQCDACITHDTLDRLGEIRVPTLISVGEDDIFTPMHFAQTIHQRITNSKLIVFPGCGHVHHWENLDEFNSKTLTFLKMH